MSHRRLLLLIALLALVPAAAPALPPVAPTVTVDGNQASVTLGAGGVSVDLHLEFEQVVGLSAANLGISARAVTPGELVGRLPDGALTTLPAGFPLMVTIEPPSSGGLSFSGVYDIELHTHDLAFTADSPLRLFKAPVGGPFVDITQGIGMGSYRTRSTGGGMSQFLIVADLRPASAVAEQKLDALDALFAAHAAAIPAGVRSQLQALLADARGKWDDGDVRGAIAATGTFADSVKAAADAGAIPNVWRSTRDLANVAGQLRAAAGTLRFSLALAE